MRVCSLCESGDREMVSGKLVVVEDDNICGACKQGLVRLERIYKKDFESRTEMRLDGIIPWPAIKRFSWPQYAAVVTSGWGVVQVEFAIGIGDTHMIAGRRSFQSWREEVVSMIVEKTEKAQTAGLEERITLESDIDVLRKKLDRVNKRESGAKERPLFSLALDHLTNATMQRQKDWIELMFEAEEMRMGGLRSKKVVRTKHDLVISRYYEDVISAFVRRVNDRKPA